MLFSTHEPNCEGARRSVAGLRLLPLVIAAVWAATAISVEVPPAPLDFRILRFGVGDLFANIILYVPLGIALRRKRFLFAVAAGAGLSAAIEIVQLLYLDRYTAVADVVANAAGACIGWWVSRWGGGRWMSGIDPIRLDRGLVLSACALFVVGVVCLSVPGTPADFANWDPECRFIAGDELTRNRAWNGSIETLAVFDRALGWREVQTLSRGEGRLEALAPLYLAGPIAPLDSIRGEPLLDEAARETFHRRLVAAGRMSVFVRFTTSDERQSGPARIAGYSKSTVAQNFSIGQQYREVIFRMRTRTTSPGGFHPQSGTRPFLEKDRATCVAATFDGRNVRLFADGRYEARLNLSARGRLSSFLSDSGLPASAMFVGALMGVVWVGSLRPSRRGHRCLVAGAMGGLAGGLILVAAGGAAALPEFAPWVPVLSAWGGAVAGESVVDSSEEWSLAG
ncbi:MAG: VanZ family protein [Candidatus Krumholzibacteriota bacterium]|nr:VanZ family protein [Candidatus Krumholzibacteriota bacterium]